MILNLYKKEGETPLARIERYKKDNPQFLSTKMTYAGRLDPMAEGVLIVLTDEDVHRKSEFLALTKEYEFEILWGISSDTYDILGEVVMSLSGPSDEDIENNTKSFEGQIEIPYPPYSSKTVFGKPLWSYAREDKLGEIEVPSKSMKIMNLDFLGSRFVGGEELAGDIERRIAKISGDFRQHEILSSWSALDKNTQYKISKFKASVMSGTYIRSLASRMGEKFNTRALAWSIKRTKVGDYDIQNSI